LSNPLTRRDFAVALALFAGLGAGTTSALAKMTPNANDQGLFYRRFRGEDEVRDQDGNGGGGSGSDHEGSSGHGGSNDSGHGGSDGSHDSGGSGSKSGSGGGSIGKPQSDGDDNDSRFGARH
jgi:hypothetical protein